MQSLKLYLRVWTHASFCKIIFHIYHLPGMSSHLIQPHFHQNLFLHPPNPHHQRNVPPLPEESVQEQNSVQLRLFLKQVHDLVWHLFFLHLQFASSRTEFGAGSRSIHLTRRTPSSIFPEKMFLQGIFVGWQSVIHVFACFKKSCPGIIHMFQILAIQ